MNDASEPNAALLEGAELSGVSFVRDYVELHFDGPVLRLLGQILVSRDGNSITSNSNQFRNWLCENIGKSVGKLSADVENSISIQFVNGDVIVLSAESSGEEFAHFISFPSKRMQIWTSE